MYQKVRVYGRQLISKDQSIPKRNREKWDRSLSNNIDFDLMNSRMRERVRAAIIKNNSKNGKENIPDKGVTYIEKKAVLFLIPRILSDFTLLYLREMDKISKLPLCRDQLTPKDDKSVILCGEKVSQSEFRVKFTRSREILGALMFVKTDRWRLSDMEMDISEKTLVHIAMWK